MEKLNFNQKQIGGSGKKRKIKNNALFAIGFGVAAISNFINDISDFASNKILELKGLSFSYNYSSSFLRFSPDANKSSLLI